MSWDLVYKWVTIQRDNGTTIRELQPSNDQSKERCDKPLTCGGICCLRWDHDDACSCDGDSEEPGDCPA
jgi:hypothetical protein